MQKLSANAAIAQSVERILGKDEVASSNLASSSRKKDFTKVKSFFQRNKSLAGFVKLPSAVKYCFAM